MTEKEIKEIRNKLPRGYRKEIKNKTNFSYSLIDRVMSGELKNKKIINAACEILNEQLKEEEFQKDLYKRMKKTYN